MLGDNNVYAVIPVKDLESARKFYEETLGLKKIDENPGGIMYQSGNSRVFVYQTELAGTNQATTANWEVNDIESVVSELVAKGVSFEHYDNVPDVTREGEIHIMGAIKSAWCKDPSGNILCIGSATRRPV